MSSVGMTFLNKKRRSGIEKSSMSLLPYAAADGRPDFIQLELDMFRMTALFVVERNKVQLLAELFKLLKLSAQASRHAGLARGSRGGATRGTQHNPNFQLQVFVFGGVMLCCAVLCCAVLCCAVLCCAVLSHAIQGCAMLCCAAPCCAVLCHAVQGCAMLCYAGQMMLQTC
jgi:hypothetical protein